MPPTPGEMRRIRAHVKRRYEEWRRAVRFRPVGDVPVLFIPLLPETQLRLAQERALELGVLTDDNVRTIH
jgi:hypothetical protein